jgi:hypothetical protein
MTGNDKIEAMLAYLQLTTLHLTQLQAKLEGHRGLRNGASHLAGIAAAAAAASGDDDDGDADDVGGSEAAVVPTDLVVVAAAEGIGAREAREIDGILQWYHGEIGCKLLTRTLTNACTHIPHAYSHAILSSSSISARFFAEVFATYARRQFVSGGATCDDDGNVVTDGGGGDAASTMNRAESLCFLQDFGVVPQLVSRRDAIAAFNASSDSIHSDDDDDDDYDGDGDGDGSDEDGQHEDSSETLVFGEFKEFLVRLAIRAFSGGRDGVEYAPVSRAEKVQVGDAIECSCDVQLFLFCVAS